MNGVQDMGGMQCFGPVRPETDEPVFHAEWERRALAVTLAVGELGMWNIDQSRSSRESLPPATYLSSSYYRIWILALENCLAELDVLTNPPDGVQALTWDVIGPRMRDGSKYQREADEPARYAEGDRVRTRMINPEGHTRLPRYARDKVGTVTMVHGAYVYPDRNAVPLGQPREKTPEWLYTVEFGGTDLWGADADPGLRVTIDAWQPYLEPADA